MFLLAYSGAQTSEVKPTWARLGRRTPRPLCSARRAAAPAASSRRIGWRASTPTPWCPPVTGSGMLNCPEVL